MAEGRGSGPSENESRVPEARPCLAQHSHQLQSPGVPVKNETEFAKHQVNTRQGRAMPVTPWWTSEVAGAMGDACHREGDRLSPRQPSSGPPLVSVTPVNPLPPPLPSSKPQSPLPGLPQGPPSFPAFRMISGTFPTLSPGCPSIP